MITFIFLPLVCSELSSVHHKWIWILNRHSTRKPKSMQTKRKQQTNDLAWHGTNSNSFVSCLCRWCEFFNRTLYFSMRWYYMTVFFILFSIFNPMKIKKYRIFSILPCDFHRCFHALFGVINFDRVNDSRTSYLMERDNQRLSYFN